MLWEDCVVVDMLIRLVMKSIFTDMLILSAIIIEPSSRKGVLGKPRHASINPACMTHASPLWSIFARNRMYSVYRRQIKRVILYMLFHDLIMSWGRIH